MKTRLRSSRAYRSLSFLSSFSRSCRLFLSTQRVPFPPHGERHFYFFLSTTPHPLFSVGALPGEGTPSPLPFFIVRMVTLTITFFPPQSTTTPWQKSSSLMSSRRECFPSKNRRSTRRIEDLEPPVFFVRDRVSFPPPTSKLFPLLPPFFFLVFDGLSSVSDAPLFSFFGLRRKERTPLPHPPFLLFLQEGDHSSSM